MKKPHSNKSYCINFEHNRVRCDKGSEEFLFKHKQHTFISFFVFRIKKCIDLILAPIPSDGLSLAFKQIKMTFNVSNQL